PNIRYHQSKQGVGFHRLLRRAGFWVYLIDEFRTNKVCPPLFLRQNTSSKSTCRTRVSTCSYGRKRHPHIPFHDLLRYVNQHCRQTMIENLWGIKMLVKSRYFCLPQHAEYHSLSLST
ncbi:MAG: hypothetical protein EXX96DRAFT_493038, partial [Benjaminiella poitrasii]